MPQEKRYRIGAPETIQAVLYRNSALYEERPGLARLVVGGPAHGQVLISQQADLALAAADGGGLAYGSADVPSVVALRHLHYSAAEVGIAGRIYRTWMNSTDSPQEHVLAAITALADVDAAQAESCRAD